jgi:hypothetical protein
VKLNEDNAKRYLSEAEDKRGRLKIRRKSWPQMKKIRKKEQENELKKTL